MVNFDRRISAFSSRCKSLAAAAGPRFQAAVTPGIDAVTSVASPRIKAISAATAPRLKLINEAAAPRLKAINAATSPRIKAITDSRQAKAMAAAAAPALRVVTPWGRALATASPKMKLVAAGGVLVFVTGVSAPAIAASQHSDAVAPATVAAAVHAAAAAGKPVTASSVTDAGGSAAAARAALPQQVVTPPTVQQLHPTGIDGYQVGYTPTTEQMRNAQMIIQAGQAMGLPPRAWVIAVATSLQETNLHNYGDLGWSNDHDSLGLFQQRPSSGWGAPYQLENPTYAAKAFYRALTNIPHWDRMPLTDAAQAVQVSAFGDRYAKWEAHAGDIVNAFYGKGPLAQIANKVM